MKRTLIAILIFSTLFLSSAFSQGIKYISSGLYTDSSGGQNNWTINDSHTILWKNQPYIPIGTIFISKYLTQGTEDSWTSDEAMLVELKSKGITSLLVKSANPLMDSKPETLQKLLDYLDSSGFTYGIEINAQPKNHLSGYLISPQRYRLEGPSDQMIIARQWKNVDSAFYVVMDKYDKSVVERNDAQIIEGKVIISLKKPLTKDNVLLVYPHLNLPNSKDLWSGYGEMRDNMLDYFKQIKFGSGLRFFLDPFQFNTDFSGEMGGFVPDSSGFKLGLEGYLISTYAHEGALSSGWSLHDNLESVDQASKFIPLWYQGRGISYAYDKQTKNVIGLDTSVSKIWTDLSGYRDKSIEAYMNGIADFLKKNVSNVPVFFKASRFNRIYQNERNNGGFDGLFAETYGSGDQVVEKVGGEIISLTEDSGKTMSAFASAAPSSTNAVYSDENSLFGTLDSLRDAGFKGAFLDVKNLGLLSNAAPKIAKAMQAEYKPIAIPYPLIPSTGAYIKRLLPGVWWLPSAIPANTFHIGDGLNVYSLALDDKTYLWSDIGNKSLTFKAEKNGVPSIDFPFASSAIKENKGMFTLNITEIPIVLRGLSTRNFFPYETATDSINKLTKYIEEAQKKKIDVKIATSSLTKAKSILKNNQPSQAYSISQDAIKKLMIEYGEDNWYEGENCAMHNFDGIRTIPKASESLALVLDNKEEPPLSPYYVSIPFTVQTNTKYDIWIACTPLDNAAQLVYSIDNMNQIPIEVNAENTIKHAPDLSWHKIGIATVYPGTHNIKFTVVGKGKDADKYFFALDSVLLTQHGFVPNGAIRPY